MKRYFRIMMVMACVGVIIGLGVKVTKLKSDIEYIKADVEYYKEKTDELEEEKIKLKVTIENYDTLVYNVSKYINDEVGTINWILRADDMTISEYADEFSCFRYELVSVRERIDDFRRLTWKY